MLSWCRKCSIENKTMLEETRYNASHRFSLRWARDGIFWNGFRLVNYEIGSLGQVYMAQYSDFIPTAFIPADCKSSHDPLFKRDLSTNMIVDPELVYEIFPNDLWGLLLIFLPSSILSSRFVSKTPATNILSLLMSHMKNIESIIVIYVH